MGKHAHHKGSKIYVLRVKEPQGEENAFYDHWEVGADSKGRKKVGILPLCLTVIEW